jgi:hypothetical protein
MGALTVRRTTRTDQFTIEHIPHGTENWDAEYVTISGHFGPYSPHLFAAAPDLLAALKSFVDGVDPAKLDTSSDPAYVLFAHKAKQALAAIAKAEVAHA